MISVLKIKVQRKRKENSYLLKPVTFLYISSNVGAGKTKKQNGKNGLFSSLLPHLNSKPYKKTF